MTQMNKPFTQQELNGVVGLFKVAPMTMFVRGARMVSVAECAQRGFVVITEGGALVDPVPANIFDTVFQFYGVDTTRLNQTFHKSFATMRDGDPATLIAQQLLNYFSTYGLEMFGVKGQNYVPVEALELPEGVLSADKLVVIRAVSNAAIVELIDKYALNTVSPSPGHIGLFKPLMKYITIPTDDIKSFELQVIKHDMDGTVPVDAQRFLRYLVYKTTGQTLIIKNRQMREMIKHQNSSYLGDKVNMPARLLGKADLTKLAAIFFRYKPIFLAYKEFPGCAPIINKIRRLADEYHKPQGDVTVKNFTTLVGQHRLEDCQTIISRASNRELIKLGNALGVRLNTTDKTPGVYAIRNGRTFVREDGLTTITNGYEYYLHALNMIGQELSQRLAKYKDRIFILPDYMDYAVPVTEKQFIGNFPWGSRITAIPQGAFTAGIHWFDQKGRVDIDLHLNSANQHFGWCGGWRDGSEVIYTGDQTAAPAPNGAAEAFWFEPGDEPFILSANLYSGPKDTEYKMFMTTKKPDERSQQNRNYTFDPASAVFTPIPLKFTDGNSMNIGMFTKDGFYFYGGAITSGIVPKGNYGAFIEGLTAQLDCRWLVSELLTQVGAICITPEEIELLNDEQKEKAIDLTPGALTATTLLDVIDGNIE